MEFLVLNDDFEAVKMVENYQSLIWTERYSKNGDFELKTGAIQETLNLLYNYDDPDQEIYVSLRDSTVPMIAEVFRIDKPKNSGPILTVTGRSFETVLERRAAMFRTPSEFSTGKEPYNIVCVKSSDAAFRAMREKVGDDIYFGGPGEFAPGINPIPIQDQFVRDDDSRIITFPPPADYMRIKQPGETALTLPPTWSSATTYVKGYYVTYLDDVHGNDIIYVSKNAVASGGAAPDVNTANWQKVQFEIAAGNLYASVMEQLAINFHGLKAVLPEPGSRTARIEIYNGADRTNEVVIDARFDQFDDTSYLFSNQGSTNVGYVVGPSASEQVPKTVGAELTTGMKRRVLYSDLSGETTPNLHDRGLIELYKYNATAIFDGQIAESVSSGYNKNYFLGDIIKLTGEYGLYRNVRIAEFIRSSDATGEKSYPALEVVES